MNALEFQACGFGWFIANGRRYENDHIITVNGEIVPRPKHLSKKYGGWHTALGPEEIEYALVDNPEILVIGCGHLGVLPIREEVRALLAARGITLETLRVRDAMARYAELARAGKRVAAILHTTC
ncbi:MAG: MTH938/NDUFAF3 family protein [Anaerolineae bacterium]|nr:MTH938/NDUFAF3 family protein [Anaerolineae bacterium]